MDESTKRLEIEFLPNAGLSERRVAEIAVVSLRRIHRGRAEAESQSAEHDAAAGHDSERNLEQPSASIANAALMRSSGTNRNASRTSTAVSGVNVRPKKAPILTYVTGQRGALCFPA